MERMYSALARRRPPCVRGQFPLYIELVTTRSGPRFVPCNWGGALLPLQNGKLDPNAEECGAPHVMRETPTAAWCAVPDSGGHLVLPSWNAENGPQDVSSIYWM